MANESGADYSAKRVNNSRPETFVIVNCVLNAPLMLISIIGNTLVLAAILRTPSLRSPSTVFLCSLAVSDFIVGLVVQPLYIVSKLTGNLYVYQVLTLMAASGTGLSLLITTAISVDRFLALHYHMRYSSLMTSHRAIYASSVLWFICFLFSLLSFWRMNAYYFSAAITIAICLLVSSCCYALIYRIVRRHHLQIRVQQQAVDILNTGNNQTDMQRSTKSAKNTFIYYIVMVLCYTPLFIALSVLYISPNHWTNIWTLTDTIAFMNSSINPVLYCWRLCELRRAVVKTARQMLCKQTEA